MAQRSWQSAFSQSSRIGDPPSSTTRARTQNPISSNTGPDSVVPLAQQQIRSLPAGDHTHPTHLNPSTTTHSTAVAELTATSVVGYSQSPLRGILMPSSKLKFF
jgi:hypothetical protein